MIKSILLCLAPMPYKTETEHKNLTEKIYTYSTVRPKMSMQCLKNTAKVFITIRTTQIVVTPVQHKDKM